MGFSSVVLYVTYKTNIKKSYYTVLIAIVSNRQPLVVPFLQ
jgi:hypothetical protein